MTEPAWIPLLEPSRFAIRAAVAADAAGIAAVQIASWQSSYRGILPDAILDAMEAGSRVERRREILRRPGWLNLVAFDTTHGDIVGYSHAGPSRRRGDTVGELYEIYLINRAKSFGLGHELFAAYADWCRERGLSMVVWVLEHNRHARRFYESLGGRESGRVTSNVSGFGVVEVAYVWDRPARA